MTEAEAEQAITMALAVLPQHARNLDTAAISATAKGWAWILDDIDSRDVLGALKRHLATSKWLPTPAEIRTIVDESHHGRRRNGGDAWGDVLREIGRTGRYREPRFDDAITARAVSRLGWAELCDSENVVADRARFIELYDQLARAAVEDRSVATLPGVARPALPADQQIDSLVGVVAKRLTDGAR